MREFDACVALQIAVWGFADGDVIPRRMFLLASHIGGQVFGAFVDGELAGFAMALPGYREGRSYLHSHMLAVLPEFRDAGLGRRLKLAQRTDAIARGISVMEWTFDPLEIKNAFFNLHRLGAVCTRYVDNFYGASSSPLQGGLPTDRLRAEWVLESEHVTRALNGREAAERAVERVMVPADVHAWKKDEAMRGKALAAQRRVREGLHAAFARGLRAIDFEVDADGNGIYLLASETGDLAR